MPLGDEQCQSFWSETLMTSRTNILLFLPVQDARLLVSPVLTSKMLLAPKCEVEGILGPKWVKNAVTKVQELFPRRLTHGMGNVAMQM